MREPHHRPYHGAVPGDAPPLDVLHGIHDRYLIEAVEELALCPFARKCRKAGRLARIPFVAEEAGPSPDAAARALASAVAADPALEIVLLVFVPRAGHPFWAPDRFDDFTRAVRAAYDGRLLEQKGLPRYYAVAFHPLPPEPAHPPTPENLVPRLRRSPDPLIQCVQAEMLDAVRAEAQRTAQERLAREIERLDPSLAPLFSSSVITDPSLSSEIAAHNFAQVGRGPGRRRLDDLLDGIWDHRNRAYPPSFVPGEALRATIRQAPDAQRP